MNIENVHLFTIATNHKIAGNLLVGQHRLRYDEVIKKEQWRGVNVEFSEDGGLEFDDFDNLSTFYFAVCDAENKVIGTTRAYPTVKPYMLSKTFNHLVSQTCLHSQQIFEATRMVVDRTQFDTKKSRKPIVNALLVAYLEFAKLKGIKAYTGFMLPAIWKSTFQRVGWEPKWIGEEQTLPTGEIVRAAIMELSDGVEERVRNITGISENILLPHPKF